MNAELKRMVQLAGESGLCGLGAKEVAKFDTVDQALASEHGPLMASLYAIRVIKRRWPEAEPTIRKNKAAWVPYCAAFGIVG